MLVKHEASRPRQVLEATILASRPVLRGKFRQPLALALASDHTIQTAQSVDLQSNQRSAVYVFDQSELSSKFQLQMSQFNSFQMAIVREKFAL